MRTASLLTALLSLFLLSGVCLAEEDTVLQRGPDGTQLKFAVAAAKPVEPVVETPSSSTATSLRFAGLWLLLLGAGASAAMFFWKRKHAAAVGKASAALSVVERISIGSNRELLLVKACNRLLVVGVQGNQMSLLSDMASEDAPAAPFAGVLATQEPSVKGTNLRELRDMDHLQRRIAKEYETEKNSAKEAESAQLQPWPELEEVR